MISVLRFFLHNRAITWMSDNHLHHAPESDSICTADGALDPLGHFMHHSSFGYDDDGILPPQPASIRGVTQCFFKDPLGTDHVTVSLATDASPGCGGVAWPAGEVRLCAA